jgi:hypothetical protein
MNLADTKLKIIFKSNNFELVEEMLVSNNFINRTLKDKVSDTLFL